MSIRLWITASRPGALVKILPPLAAGLALGYRELQLPQMMQATPQILRVLATLLFGWFLQMYIIFLNDFADRKADSVHFRDFPELIDRRVIPQGLVRPQAVLLAGVGAGVLALLCSAFASLFLERQWAFLICALALSLYPPYSFEPFKLNYRGGGEILETIGVGLLLPFIGYYLYTGTGGDYQPLLTLPYIVLSAAAALLSGIKHEPADRRTGKKTVAVLAGIRPTVILIVVLMIASGIHCLVFFILKKYHLPALITGVLLPAILLLPLLTGVQHIDPFRPNELKRFKRRVNLALYSTTFGLILDFALTGGGAPR